MDGTYAGSYGRIRSYYTDFLDDAFMASLVGRKNDEIGQMLLKTNYREDLEALSSTYSGRAHLENAINRHFVKKNKLAISSPPPGVKDFLKLYVSKWDIDNIKILLASKELGHKISLDDTFIVNSRGIPMGVFAGNISPEEFRVLLGLPSLESSIDYLSRHSVGVAMASRLDEYRRTADLSFLFTAMDTFYFSEVLRTLLFIRGDESPVRSYFRDYIDLRNIMVILKARDQEMDFAIIKERLSPGGSISPAALEDLFRNSPVADIYQSAGKVAGGESEQHPANLSDLEIMTRMHLYRRYHPSFMASSISVNTIFDFVLTAERERDILRGIVIGSSYGMKNDSVLRLTGMGV